MNNASQRFVRSLYFLSIYIYIFLNSINRSIDVSLKD